MFTLHGAIMVFLFIIPAIPGALGNFVLPMMLGAKDVAFPRLNLASFYIYVVGAIFALLLDRHRRRRHRLDVLHALQHDDQHGGDLDDLRRLHPRLLLDLHRPQLHRHDPQAARRRA